MSMRAQALRSGAYLSIREFLGIGIRLLGTLVVTRLIGPENYGLYAGPLAAVTFLAAVAQLGIGVYLIRARENPDRATYDALVQTYRMTGNDGGRGRKGEGAG